MTGRNVQDKRRRGIAPPLVAMVIWYCTVASFVTAEPYYIREDWLDKVRQRHVNVRISFPESIRTSNIPEALPVLLFSTPQGWRWGGHRDYYEYLAEEMANRGVSMVTISHYEASEKLSQNETFDEVYPGILTGTRHDAAVDRYEDSLFVLRELARINTEQRPGWPVLDVSTLAVGGHSSGVLTALHLSGLPVRDQHNQIYAQHQEPLVKAFVVFGYPLEYSGPSRRDLKQVGSIPGLHVAGSEDHPRYRHTSYRYISGAPQYWLVVPGNHNVGAEGSLSLLGEITGRFISAYLLGDQTARRNLVYTAFEDPKEEIQQFQHKFTRPRWLWDHRDFVAWARESMPWGKWLHDWSVAYHRTQEELKE
jgi:hypothetical protein